MFQQLVEGVDYDLCLFTAEGADVRNDMLDELRHDRVEAREEELAKGGSRRAVCYHIRTIEVVIWLIGLHCLLEAALKLCQLWGQATGTMHRCQKATLA